MSGPILHASRGASSRYWVLVHAAMLHNLCWDDGERLLALSSDVRSGAAEPQAFTFLPKGCVDPRERVEVFVRADEPLDLFTEYEPPISTVPSHWFG